MQYFFIKLLVRLLLFSAPQQAVGSKEFVFGDHPGFAQCHASTVLHLKNGQFLVAWFGGTKEKHDDVGIWLARRISTGWEAPRQVAKIRYEPHWNPVLFQAPSGKIFLYFKVGKEIEQWESWAITSVDGGISWSAPAELVAGDKGGRGPVKNKPIILADGSWLAGASHEADGYHIFTDRSTDQGKSWQASAYIPLGDSALVKQLVIQPTLWESAPGKVHLLCRTSIGAICRSDSDDGGKTWSPIYKTALPNPNSGIDLTKLPDGRLVLAYNPDTANWGSRAPLLLAVSADNGHGWPKQLVLEAGSGEDEFSYPAIISYGDSIAVTYTWQRKNIRFWKGHVKDIGFK
jgi:predicted neuraminidase